MRKFTKAKGSAFRQPTPKHVLAARLELDLTVEQAAGILGRQPQWWADRESGARPIDPVIFWCWRYWAQGKDAPPIGEWRLYPHMNMHMLLEQDDDAEEETA